MAMKSFTVLLILSISSLSFSLTPSTHSNMRDESSQESREIIIVGAGFAGLGAARQLLEDNPSFKVTLLEASSDVGGRIKVDREFVPGNALDLGAEFIHCQNHVLWDWIREFWGDKEAKEMKSENSKTELFEPIFLLSHADGGPQRTKTDEGKYGMYYLDSELVMYDDPRLDNLNLKLEAIAHTGYSIQDSLADALRAQEPPLSDSLWQLAVSSYGNTAGCSDLSQLSISQLANFEHYWETNEEEGDFRPPSKMGMHGIAQSCLERLEQFGNFSLIRNCEVQSIRQDPHGSVIKTKNDELLHADAVVVTVPPPILPKIVEDLPESKREALTKIGFERAVKVVVKLKERLWPSHLQSIISAGEPIPEIWFREMTDEQEMTYYLATGFLVSDAADEFVDLVNSRVVQRGEIRHEIAGNILFQQLLSMLDTLLPKEIGVDDSSLLVDTLMFDWKDDAPYAQGGYMYPRVGITPSHLQALAEPFGSCFFAGEATNTNACCTVQAAIETGLRAASQVESFLSKSSEPELVNTQ